MMNTGAIIQDLIDWIDNHLDSRLDIDVARRAGYSKWHLQRIFKRTYQAAPRRIYSGAKAAKIPIQTLGPQQRADPERGDCPRFDSQRSFNRGFKRQVRPGARRLAPEVSAALLRRHLSAIRMTGEGQS